jgi:superfamily II DNA/RNA helicase
MSEERRELGRARAIMLAVSAALACAYQLAPPLSQPRVPQRRAPPPVASFAEIGLRGELCDALEEVGITEPNDLQRRVMPALAGRADVLIGARTGSGKTLAYLLPIMQTLRTDEEQGGSRARARRPRALVLLPTRELALQVRDVARSLCRPLKISVAAVHGGVPEGSQKRMLEQPVDLLVATPGRLLQAPACACTL